MITVREMSFDDLDEVIAIEEACFSVPWTVNGFFSWLLREDACFFVACKDGKIAGYCGLILTPPEGDITNICVSEQYRRQGVAVLLMNALTEKAQEHGIDIIHLEVRESNAPARALYEKLGFKQDGLRPRYYEEPKEDAILMSCSCAKE